MHNPQLQILDEPFIGSDIIVEARFRSFILHIDQEGCITLPLTTHDLSDILKMNTQVMIINLGKLIYNGKLDLQQEKFAANLIHRSLPGTKFYILEALQAEIQTITRKFYEGILLE